ncbi:unnamed protein product [Caenorhabditis auriculariae]|uniref:Uncharacterized protein n=1 Tax=Caenorhabditis auriculariae TaxID=2777116 RepID=A0A8S1I080_9PELO|nr:unnamed protein product [Caenorhabditis auriculariae]
MPNRSQTASGPDIDEKLAMLHREMASLRVECDRLLNKHLIVEHTLSQSCSQWPNADTSSAYNTGGESCRSVSVTPDGAILPAYSNSSTVIYEGKPCQSSQQVKLSPRGLHRTAAIPSPSVQRRVPTIVPSSPPTVILPHDSPLSGHRPIHKTTALNESPKLPTSTSQASMVTSSTSPKSTIRFAPKAIFNAFRGASMRKLSISKNIPTSKRKEVVEDVVQPQTSNYDAASEYAKRFRIPSYSIVMKEERTPKPESRISMPHFFRSTKPRDKLYHFAKPEEEIEEVVDEEKTGLGPDGGTVHYKWKLKKRCDGSRYVVRRPIRNQILKKREAQLSRERAPISTDDDAMSELKLGKFHSREERRKQLERERMKKMLKLQQKMNDKKPSDQTIVQLSQQKMARQKDKMVLDEFVTTREVLSHRTDANGIRGVVSVTTV